MARPAAGESFDAAPRFALDAAVGAVLAWLARPRCASYHGLPHDRRLRLLVEGGLVGPASYAAAILVWAWRVLDPIRPGKRAFVWALLLALGA